MERRLLRTRKISERVGAFDADDRSLAAAARLDALEQDQGPEEEAGDGSDGDFDVSGEGGGEDDLFGSSDEEDGGGGGPGGGGQSRGGRGGAGTADGKGGGIRGAGGVGKGKAGAAGRKGKSRPGARDKGAHREGGSARKTRGMLEARDKGPRSFRDWLEASGIPSGEIFGGVGATGAAGVRDRDAPGGGGDRGGLGGDARGQAGSARVPARGRARSQLSSYAEPTDESDEEFLAMLDEDEARAREEIERRKALKANGTWVRRKPGRPSAKEAAARRAAAEGSSVPTEGGDGPRGAAGNTAGDAPARSGPASRVPPHPLGIELAPALQGDYVRASAPHETTASRRKFCSVCGVAAKYSCVRCGSRYCSLRCATVHTETRCLKMLA